MRVLAKYLRKVLIIIMVPPLIYSILVLIGGLITVNRTSVQHGPIKIYLVQNGSHSDIIVPIQNETFNWENIILPEHFPANIKNAKYYSFGWGDREFYRTTPYWEDLKLKTAFNSLFLNTPSALHIRRLSKIDSEKIVEIEVNVEQYKKLTEYFLKHFQFESDKSLRPLNFHYSSNDVFYASKSSFHAFRTCNSWANNALKYSGLRSCLWTPFAWPLFWQHS
ncbi:TIGR02117 family protein [Gramella jeungdoensis]|uniref:TIGR02117 family protein n=1 Tax=Gramella jeungdoensis TaxID=708091 RepID=A0ABT0YYK9_9FLAO|nr:TIGR02117 family protein [Gramella jeungdoensis]MCM8568213.1 TIGR02117 family protein [Gramella jeungdoensis]